MLDLAFSVDFWPSNSVTYSKPVSTKLQIFFSVLATFEILFLLGTGLLRVERTASVFDVFVSEFLHYIVHVFSFVKKHCTFSVSECVKMDFLGAVGFGVCVQGVFFGD